MKTQEFIEIDISQAGKFAENKDLAREWREKKIIPARHLR